MEIIFRDDKLIVGIWNRNSRKNERASHFILKYITGFTKLRNRNKNVNEHKLFNLTKHLNKEKEFNEANFLVNYQMNGGHSLYKYYFHTMGYTYTPIGILFYLPLYKKKILSVYQVI